MSTTIAPFRPGANAIYRVLGVCALLLPFAVVLALMLLARSPVSTLVLQPIMQPIDFDHRHHAGDDQIGCLYCHDLATRSAYAGVPPTSRCLNCHAQIWNDAPILDPVRQSSFSGKPIDWVRVNRLPDYVYFDHSIHVNKGVGCASCHGRVDLMPAIVRTAPLSMGWCLGCHRNPEPHLRPSNEITSMIYRAPEDPAFQHGLADRYDVHPGTHCTTCHR